MKLLYITLLALALQACQSEKRQPTIQPLTLAETIAFKKEHHLFLNYYFGMSIADYEHATKKNFVEHRVFLGGEKETCRLKNYIPGQTNAQELDLISYHSLVFYPFEINGEEFEAVVNPVFKYDRLVKIELQTLNCFTVGNHRHDFYRRKIGSTHQALIEHHSAQFGKYDIAEKVPNDEEMTVINNAGVNLAHFDIRKYRFNDQTKVVTIEQKCCDFKPVVSYTHQVYVDYLHKPSAENEAALEAQLYHYRAPGEI